MEAGLVTQLYSKQSLLLLDISDDVICIYSYFYAFSYICSLEGQQRQNIDIS